MPPDRVKIIGLSRNRLSTNGDGVTTLVALLGIQRLVKVTDTEGNQTLSTYDMGDRRTEVNHPASGITSFTYDPLGNVLTKQTANMAEEGKMITYSYDYHRLTGINYPDHPENNVKYYYGGRNASYNRIGRLMMREDGTGAIEYFYGKMGEVTKTRRTLIVPNQAIATYVTQWTYDSHNRLIEMIYPDEEKVTYSYNLGGLLEKVRGEKSYGYDYITKLGYDKFEQRSYLKYCNGAETFYTYDNRRRLSNLAVNSGGASIMDNAYTFDAVSNVLSVANNASLPANGNAGGQMSHTYTYDGLYRLATAMGTYTGADNKSASYTLAMGYDNMHRIKSKRQHLTQDNVQFNGTLNVGYDLTYTYGSEAGKKFQLESVKDVNYRTEETPEGQQIENGHGYTYDKNGNLVYVNTNRVMTDGHRDNSVGERKLIWDEENRLLAVDDNGFVSNYWYDADGERTVKTSGESDQVYVNGVFSGGSTNTAKFSLYVSPYLVANQGGRYTKHIYAGSQRIVSKVGDFASYGSDPRRIEYAGANTDGLSVDYKSKYAAQQQVIKDNYKFFDVPYNGTDNDNYADGEGFCCNDGSMEAAVAQARKAQTRAVSRSFKDPDNYENLQFFYHPDHLGSSSFITNLDGEVVQHIEYVPFGEVFIEERNNVWNTPYLFNAKEFDEETGMYYYGARYYDPRLSLWMSTDPKSEEAPAWSPYRAFFNNPIAFVDPDGKWEENADGNLVANKGDNAKSLAEYLNTSHGIAAKMLSEQGYNKNGTSNIVEGSIFQVERTSQQRERSDLGYLGNIIRSYAGSNFSKDMFENYWNGNGDVELSGKRFAGILLDIKADKIPMTNNGEVILKSSDGTSSKGSVHVANFYNSNEYSLAFGRATIYKNADGNVVGFYDFYDFDTKSWGTRHFKNEVKTRAVRYASPSSAKPFAIRYGYSNRK
nr:RHS repeat-associated core domain-containing protein [uncultured Duncaniella sp.]